MALTTIGQLVHGDTIPSSQPRRYKTRAGYIKLRWKVGVRQYVEAYEHRVVCGLPDAHVHIAAALGETPAVVRQVCRDMGLPSFRPGAPKMTETVGWR